jgi:hypothetical protein
MEVGFRLIFWMVYPQENSTMHLIYKNFVGLRGKLSLFLHENSVPTVQLYLDFGDWTPCFPSKKEEKNIQGF